MAIDGYRLPPDEQLLATIVCSSCESTFTAFEWPTTATIASPTSSTSTPVPVTRDRCPRCGGEVAHPA